VILSTAEAEKLVYSVMEHKRFPEKFPLPEDVTSLLIAYISLVLEDPDSITSYHLQAVNRYLSRKNIIELTKITLREADMASSTGRIVARINKQFSKQGV